MTKHPQALEVAAAPACGAGAPDQMFTISRAALAGAVILELLDYFSDARVTGLKLQKAEAEWIAGGVLQRVLRDRG